MPRQISTYDLRTDAGLREASQRASTTKANPEWHQNLKAALSRMREASEADRATIDFQRWLWDDNPVASVGQGQISVEEALNDEAFRNWLARESVRTLPDGVPEREAALEKLYEEIQARLKPLCTRMPHLKIFRVLALLFPLDLTTIADRSALTKLRLLMLAGKFSAVAQHVGVRRRLDDVLGRVDGNNLDQVTERLILPWLLYDLVTESEQDPTTTVVGPGKAQLLPLPAVRRRRGLTAIGGMFQRVLSILEVVGDGMTREELMQHLRATNPKAKDVSLGMTINVLKSELGTIRSDGQQYVLSERGRAVLESQDPDELRDWLLTRVLGVDNVILILRDRKQVEVSELIRDLQEVNPGWTSTFGPKSLLSWLRSLDVVELRADESLELTERGRSWAECIHWKPEKLSPDENGLPTPKVGGTKQPEQAEIPLPALATIWERVKTEKFVFPFEQVASLHMGLWAHPRRHFAILTGLSGSGKTLLATTYARAVIGEDPAAEKRLEIVAVQPGWYDPTPLFGYVNPLETDSYEATSFLKLLLRAGEHPERPHVAVLDEMNLSHPEQYLAPILSAMETGAEIPLHSRDEALGEVPSRVPYPSNLVIIGTVNMDETTLGLSDKVLDRAFVEEFWNINLDEWPYWGTRGLSGDDERKVQVVLGELMLALQPVRLHFGWRVVDEVFNFLVRRAKLGIEVPFLAALDRVIYAKIVPKLRGEDSPRLRKALEDCERTLKQHGLKVSGAKVSEMIEDLSSTGSARFWR
jgi:hypothetical protein